jgi:hypothetical protein
MTEQNSRNTFYWLFVPLIQDRLDTFCDYWNNHQLTGNSKKSNPYGSLPQNILLNLISVHATAKDCLIRVDPELIAQMREAYGGKES